MVISKFCASILIDVARTVNPRGAHIFGVAEADAELHSTTSYMLTIVPNAVQDVHVLPGAWHLRYNHHAISLNLPLEVLGEPCPVPSLDEKRDT